MHTPLICLTFLLQIYSNSATDPWEIGPHTVEHKIFGYLNTGLNAQLGVWYPNAEGNFPVIYFLTGLGNIIPASAYGDVLTHISSHGYVVVSTWELTGKPYDAEWMIELQHWIDIHLEDKLHANGAVSDFHINIGENILMGHSAGAHVAVEYLKHHCNRVVGQVLLSPVDGIDPFGLIDNYCITPGQLLNYNIPTLMLSTGLDDVPGFNLIGDIVPACAPDELSNRRFYDAMTGPTWWLNATVYGHGDLLDEFYYGALQVTHFCATDGDQDRVIYRAFIGGEVVAFLDIILNGNCEYLPYLEDPLSVPVDVVMTKKDSVDEESQWTCGSPAYCKWEPESDL